MIEDIGEGRTDIGIEAEQNGTLAQIGPTQLCQDTIKWTTTGCPLIRVEVVMSAEERRLYGFDWNNGWLQ